MVESDWFWKKWNQSAMSKSHAKIRGRYKVKKLSRVWFYPPEFYWFGLKTLSPIYFGADEYSRKTIMLGWTITGRMIIAYSKFDDGEDNEETEVYP